MDREKVIKALGICVKKDCVLCPYTDWCGEYDDFFYDCTKLLAKDALVLLYKQKQDIWELQDQVEYLTDKQKEQEKKEIKIHKKHVITWGRNDEFSMRNLYEAICETLLDEGELFIARTDDHEKVEFVFYVIEGR